MLQLNEQAGGDLLSVDIVADRTFFDNLGHFDGYYLTDWMFSGGKNDRGACLGPVVIRRHNIAAQRFASPASCRRGEEDAAQQKRKYQGFKLYKKCGL